MIAEYKEELSPDTEVSRVSTSYSAEIQKSLEENQQEEKSKSTMEDIMFNYYKKNA